MWQTIIKFVCNLFRSNRSSDDDVIHDINFGTTGNLQRSLVFDSRFVLCGPRTRENGNITLFNGT